MKLHLLSADDLRSALPMPEAIETMKHAYASLSTHETSAPPRGVVRSADGDGTTLIMGARVPDPGLGAKVVSIFHGNASRGRKVVNGLTVVLDPGTGEPVGLCDGTFLTAWRTGAASGAATDLLARADATVGAVIGTGAQARMQILGIDTARSLRTIRVFGLEPQRARALADDLQPEIEAALEVVETTADAVLDAHVVCTATNSFTPVFSGAHLSPGTHVNGIGSFTLEMREVDHETVRRSRVFVDSQETALAEAGDLVIAEREGATNRSDWTEIGLVAKGLAPGREHPDEITFFKSVGHAVQDVAAAVRAFAVARERGAGREIEI